MSSNFTLLDNDEIYILTLNRIFKIKTIHLINDLNNRLEKCIKTRVKDICSIVNSTFDTNYTETTIDELITRLNKGEMNDLFHSYDVNHLVASYISNPLSDTEATLTCLKPFTDICIRCKTKLESKMHRYIDLYDIDKISKAGVYTCCCSKCHFVVSR